MSNHQSGINVYSQACYKIAVLITHSNKYMPEEGVLIDVYLSHQVGLVTTVKIHHEKFGVPRVNCEIMTCVISNTQLSRDRCFCANHGSLGYVSCGRFVLVFVHGEDVHLICGEVLYIGVHFLDYTNTQVRYKVGVVKVVVHQLFYFVNSVGVMCLHDDYYGDDVSLTVMSQSVPV